MPKLEFISSAVLGHDLLDNIGRRVVQQYVSYFRGMKHFTRVECATEVPAGTALGFQSRLRDSLELVSVPDDLFQAQDRNYSSSCDKLVLHGRHLQLCTQILD